jgi:hypothetical protein
MEIKLNALEMLAILNGLEALHDQAKEYKDVVYDNQQDFLIDLNNIRAVHNKLLIQAQNEDIIDKEASLI